MLPASRRLPLAALAAALLLGACGDADGDDAELAALREEVAELRDGGVQLEAELDELRDALTAVAAPEDDVDDEDDADADDPVAALDGALADLVTRVDELEATRPSIEDARGFADEAASDIRGAIAELRAALDETRGELVLLEDLVERLQQRLDDHSHD